MLPYSPVTAMAAVARPSNRAPAKADVMNALIIVLLLGVLGAYSL
jgi:hypothetical protein